MPPKKKIKVENENNDKKIKNKSAKSKPKINGLKKSIGRPKKSLSLDSSNGLNPKRKKCSDKTQSQITFTFKEKKAFYECLTENGFSVIHNKTLLSKSLPNRSVNQINSLIETYSRRGQELNKRNEESVDSETNSDKQPIEKWFDLIHQTIPNTSKKDDISLIFAEIFDELAKDCDQKSSSRASSSQMNSNYSQIYHYISETLRGKCPPELQPIDAFIVLKLIEELKELFKSDDYEIERQYLDSGKWWANNVKTNEDYYSAIHLQRQQESPDLVNTSQSKQETNEGSAQINQLSQMESTEGQSSRSQSSRSSVAKVKNSEILENGQTSETSISEIEESERKNIAFLLNFPKLRKIADCLNPIQVPIDLSKEEFNRWQK